MFYQIIMFDELDGVPDIGGDWIYNGPNTVDFIVDGIQGTYTPSSPVGVAGLGHETILNTSVTPGGAFSFTYTVKGASCNAISTLTVSVNPGTDPSDYIFKQQTPEPVLLVSNQTITSLKDSVGTELLSTTYNVDFASATLVSIPGLITDIQTYLGVGNYTTISAGSSREGVDIEIIGAVSLNTFFTCRIEETGNPGNNILSTIEGQTQGRKNVCDYSVTVSTSGTKKLRSIGNVRSISGAASTFVTQLYSNGYDFSVVSDFTRLKSDLEVGLNTEGVNFASVNVIPSGVDTATILVYGADAPLSYVRLDDAQISPITTGVEFIHFNCSTE